MSRIIKPLGRLARMVDPTQKIFEGETKVSIYEDRLEISGYCWHCKGSMIASYGLTRGEYAQVEKDEQFKQNVMDLAADRLQDHHQCGALIHDNKFTDRELARDLGN